MELICQLDLVLFVWFRCFWGLTCDFWAENAEKNTRATADPLRDDNKKGIDNETVNATTTATAAAKERATVTASCFPLTFDRSGCILLSNVEGKMPSTSDLLQGTLDLLILRTLALESMHGWGIAQRIQQVSKDALQIGQGSLYPALHRLEYKGWISCGLGSFGEQPQGQVLFVDGDWQSAVEGGAEGLGSFDDGDWAGVEAGVRGCECSRGF